MRLTYFKAPRSKIQKSLLRPDATYILIGGTGGLGRSMAKWMLGKGAKTIVLLSRSGAVKGKAKDQIDELNATGANIVVRRCDVANKAEVEDLVSNGLSDLPPIRGLIHGAMVLHVSSPIFIRRFKSMVLITVRMSSSKK
jgi:NAD(P)-dependent dehydrogenase (short-subunit alcohol dehydrogenase family)